jgi:DNA-binding CsgD family transcriptional regulator
MTRWLGSVGALGSAAHSLRPSPKRALLHQELLTSARWRAATSAAALALFAIIFALAIAIEQGQFGVLHLHAVPIAILALQLGILAGLSAVAFSLSLTFVWAEIEGAELLMVDYMGGAVPLLLVVFLCQFAVQGLRHQGAAANPGRLLNRLRSNHETELTDREKEVLGLLALGYTNREVAEQLHLSVRTVESHRARIQQKLDISSRAELVRYALDHDLLRDLPILTDSPTLQPAP